MAPPFTRHLVGILVSARVARPRLVVGSVASSPDPSGRSDTIWRRSWCAHPASVTVGV